MSTEKQSIDALLAERGRTHGEYADHAQVTQDLLAVMQAVPSWAGLPAIIKETLHMTAHKVGRVLTGNPFLRDHWDDTAGYSRLVSQRINADQTGLADEYVRPRPEPLDVDHEPAHSAEQAGLVLTSEDVGRQFLRRDGRTATVVREDEHPDYPIDVESPELHLRYSVMRTGYTYSSSSPQDSDLVTRLSEPTVVSEKPVKLTVQDVGKRFRTRDGQIATIERTNPHHTYPFVMRLPDRGEISVMGDGSYSHTGAVNPLDLVARVD